MKLISCYIANFGGLHQFSYKFHDGLNVILEENGWGKTTFAVFLKAMFYGMERSTKRSLYENERKKYEPWNGGAFGGNLVFEADGKEYRLERFFGTKDKLDTFVLYDVYTGLKSDVYTENIGEEIFGIDRNAFEQSIFMKQGNYAISLNDSLNAKMSGLMASGDDLDCYEKACTKLENEMKVYKAKVGNKGKIPELTERISILGREISDGKHVAVALQEWKQRSVLCMEELERYSREREALKQKIRNAGELAFLQEKERHYNEILEEKQKLGKELEFFDEFFRNGVPTEEELENYRKKIFLYHHMEIADVIMEQNYRYPDLAAVLQKNPITEEELDACEQKWISINEKEQMLELKRIQLQNQQKREAEQEQLLWEQIEVQKGKQRLSVIVAVIALVVAVVLFIFVNAWSGGISLGFMFLCIILAVIFRRRWQELFEDAGEESAEAEELEKECSDLEKSIENMKKAVRMYLRVFPISDITEIPSSIGKIRITIMEINVGKQKLARQNEIEINRAKEKEALRKEIIIFLRRFYDEISDAEEGILKEIEKKRGEYIHISRLYDQKCEKLAKAEKIEFLPEKNEDSVEELQQAERLLDEQMRKKEEQFRRIEQTIAEYTETLEKCEKLEMEKLDLEELLEDYSAKYKLLEKTLKYLKTAQIEFSSRYLKKINSGYAKYVGFFRKDALEHSSVDIKLSIKYDEDGVKREVGYLSTGLRETMELCTRFALVEAIFEKERPFVVLDDPFVNMDEKSLKGAKRVLVEISKQYQLLYFTCHPSRQ